MFDPDALLYHISFTYFICWFNWQLTQNPFHLEIRSPCFVFSQSPEFWVRANPWFLWVCLCIPNIKVWCHEGRSCRALKLWAQGSRTVKRLVGLACLTPQQSCTGNTLTYFLLNSPLRVRLLLAAECLWTSDEFILWFLISAMSFLFSSTSFSFKEQTNKNMIRCSDFSGNSFYI